MTRIRTQIFDNESLQQLSDTVRRLKEQVDFINRRIKVISSSEKPTNVFPALTSAEIPARSGTTPGKGVTNTLYRVKDSDDLTSITTPVPSEVYNVSTTKVMAGDYFLAIEDSMGKYWAMLNETGEGSAGNIFRVKANAFFEPGDTGASMDLLSWNSGTSSWDDSGSDVTCRNTGKDCCMIEDEENWAVKVDDDDYELQPFGLFRRAQTTGAIDVGSTGSVNLIDHSGGTCAGTEKTSAHSVTVCNGDATNNGFRKLFDNEEVWIKHFENKWHVVSIPRVQIAGKPTTQLQSGSTGTFDVYYLNSSGTWVAWGSNTVSARNTTGMTFETDFLYSIEYYGNSDLPNAFPLEIEVF